MMSAVSVISFLTIIPAAYMCYLPMEHQLRFPKGRIIQECLLLLVLGAAGMLAMGTLLPTVNSTLTLLPFLIIFCFYYIHSTRASVIQNIGIFAAVCAMMAIASELAYIISGVFFKEETVSDNSLIANLLQLVFAVLIALLYYRPLKREGTYIVDNLRIDWIWFSSVPISAGIFVMLVLTVPMIFSDEEDPMFYGSILCLAFILILLYGFMVFLFLKISRTLMSEDQLKAQETIFKMQRQQYESMKQTLEENRIVRHDIKHAMQLVQKLLRAGKEEEVLRYLDVRLETLPTDSVHQYCEDGILNAVLNTIADRCEETEVNLKLDVDIPHMEEHQSVDVANFLQNLAENSIYGCETVPPKDRRFALTVKAPHGDELFIVSTNTFDGNIQIDNRNYRSTRVEDGGSGLGIPSMRAITSKYGGVLEISNTETEFMVNARMKMWDNHYSH